MNKFKWLSYITVRILSNLIIMPIFIYTVDASCKGKSEY